jgi:phage terminase large subunit-like protein
MAKRPAPKRPATRKKKEPPADPVTQYALDVVSLKEIAGPYVRAACQRHLDDLKTAETRGLYFDVDEVTRTLAFFRRVLTVEGDGEFVPFEPHSSQVFIIGSIFGWYIEEKGKGKNPSIWRRRFRTAYVEQGKGNGKSPLAAGVAMKCFVADGELSAEVYMAATKKDQAMISFTDAVKMRQNSPHLEGRIGKSGANPVWQLYHTASGSIMKPLSKEGAHSGPRPNCCVVDEYHEHKSADLLEMLEAGFKKRPNPILFIITNSGADKASPCGVMHDFCVKVVTGALDEADQDAADQTFAYICAMDEDDDPLKDSTVWKKANPLLGITIKEDYLSKRVSMARAIPAKQNGVLRLNFCMWTDAADAWVTRETWEACERPALTWESMKGRRCYIGLDLSFTTDMSALALCFPDEDGGDGFDLLVKFWRPEEGLAEAVDGDKVRYDIWAKNGDIELTPGKVIRLAPIGQTIARALDDFNVQAIAYDNYRHKELSDMLADMGVVGPMIEHPQGFRRGTIPHPNLPNQKIENPLWMPSSCQEFENAIIEARARIAVNAALRWNVSSAVVRDNPAGTDDWIFDKRRATGRIDGLVAAAMAVGAAKGIDNWALPASPWEDPSYSLQKV